jgi:3-oxoacyl-[acyl-carrier protein] reductase
MVLVSSTSALFGEAGNTGYAAAKSALAFGFARTLKNEIGQNRPARARECGGARLDGNASG